MKKWDLLRPLLCLALALALCALSGCAGGAASDVSSEGSSVSADDPESRASSSAAFSSSSLSSFPSSQAASELEAVSDVPKEASPAIDVLALGGALLFEAPDGVSAAGSPLAAGQPLTVLPTDDPLWYECAQEDGSTAYVYAEWVHRENETRSLYDEWLERKLAELKSQLPEGKYWNHMWNDDVSYGDETPWLVSDTPCQHWDYGETYCNFYNGAMKSLFPSDTLCQCAGFASFLSDQIFGTNAPLHTFYDYSMLRVGDHIRLAEWEHSMTVTAVGGDGVTVAEVNRNYEDCAISWSRTLSWGEVESYDWDATYISRYPMRESFDENGNCLWEAWEQ